MSCSTNTHINVAYSKGAILEKNRLEISVIDYNRYLKLLILEVFGTENSIAVKSAAIKMRKVTWNIRILAIDLFTSKGSKRIGTSQSVNNYGFTV